MTFQAVFCADGAPLDVRRFFVRDAMFSRPEVKLLGKREQAGFAFVQDDGWPDVCKAHLSFDGRNWLIGRIRLDRRADLIAALGRSNEIDCVDRGDHDLCLAAYARWSEDFFNYLYGDFCFALWDDEKQALLCARDQIGVRPLFAAQIGSRWIVSDSLAQVRSIPGLDGRLDPIWIADFLTNVSGDPGRSAYAAVKRIPGGHYLKLHSGAAVLRQYWKLELREPLGFANPQLYIDEFHALLTKAVADRMPAGRVGISLSGGLDSSTLAAKAVEVSGDSARVVGQTRVFHSLIPDDEAYFSGLVAAKLDIRHSLIAQDAISYDPKWREQVEVFSEPCIDIVSHAAEMQIAAEMRDDAEVWFFGEGPDNALTFEWRPYLRWLWATGRWGRLARASLDFVRLTRGKEWAKALRRVSLGKCPWIAPPPSELPNCINPDFARETDVKSRLAEQANHPWRPTAFASFTSSIWQQVLESFEPTFAGPPLEWRHPYLDLRVLNFLLAVPPIPWAKRKGLMRQAMRDVLPAEVISRDKTPLRVDPLPILLSRHPLPRLSEDSPVARYVDVSKIPAADDNDSELPLRISVLDHWLRQRGYA